MVTPGSAARTGVGGWDWTGLGWVRKGLGSGSRRQWRILPAAAPRPLDPELQRRTPGTTSREALHTLTSGSCLPRSTSEYVVLPHSQRARHWAPRTLFPSGYRPWSTEPAARGALWDRKGGGRELQFPEGCAVERLGRPSEGLRQFQRGGLCPSRM